jgi:hypothetical protein
MADHQKIHPVHDVEAPQTPKAPLVPRNASKSDQGDPAVVDRHPPFQRTLPVVHSKPPKKRSCCCKCFCWTISLILLQVILIGIAVGIIFLVFQPKLPKFSVDKLLITQFNISDSDNSLNAVFDVTITAINPNKKIGIYYEGGSQISGWYIDTQLCSGALPKFYQGHKNTTVLNLALTGQSQNATGLLSSLQQQQQATGNIPLTLKVNQPVRVKLGQLKLFKVKFKVRCTLLVDNLAANNQITISSSRCKFRLRL